MTIVEVKIMPSKGIGPHNLKIRIQGPEMGTQLIQPGAPLPTGSGEVNEGEEPVEQGQMDASGGQTDQVAQRQEENAGAQRQEKEGR